MSHQQPTYDAAQGSTIFNPLAAPTAALVPVSTVAVAQGPVGSSEPVKRKRGRPKRNGPNVSPFPISRAATLAIVPSPVTAVPFGSNALATSGITTAPVTPFPTVAGVASTSTDPVKKRGRPHGSINKQHDVKEPEVKLTHHVITATAGECISKKIMALSHDVNSKLCILTANGAISRAKLRHPSSGSVTYEGQYEIITLGGSLLLSNNSGPSHRSGGLNVTLFGPNGHVEGGVTGDLIAASTTQVVLLSFPGDYCSESEMVNQPGSSSAPLGGQN